MATGTHEPDDSLIQAARDGDERSAAILYERHADRVFRIIYRIILDETLAKDIAQETWIKVFRNLKQYRLGSSFPAWVSAITVRTAIDALRQRKRLAPLQQAEEPQKIPAANAPTAWTQLLDEEIEIAVERALQRLPETQRAAFVLRHFECVPLREIAQILGCAEGTVKAHIHRAIQILRNDLAFLLDKKVERS